MRTDMVLDALEMARPSSGRRRLIGLDRPLRRRQPDQYTSFRYSDRLAEVNVSASVGSRGDSYDKAMAESLHGTLKAGLIKLLGPWRTRDATEIAIIEWIDWYNAVRLHGEIGDVPPAEFEAD